MNVYLSVHTGNISSMYIHTVCLFLIDIVYNYLIYTLCWTLIASDKLNEYHYHYLLCRVLTIHTVVHTVSIYHNLLCGILKYYLPTLIVYDNYYH